MKTTLTAIIGLVLVAATPAFAQTAEKPKSDLLGNMKFSASAGMSLYNGGEDLRFSAATARGTLMITPNFGAELEFSTGTGEADLPTFNVGPQVFNSTLGLGNQISAFAVAKYPLSENSNVFARLGYAKAEFDVEVKSGNQSASDSFDSDDFMWGFGGEYFFTKNIGVRGDISGFKAEGDSVDSGLDIYSLSLVARF